MVCVWFVSKLILQVLGIYIVMSVPPQEQQPELSYSYNNVRIPLQWITYFKTVSDIISALASGTILSFPIYGMGASGRINCYLM